MSHQTLIVERGEAGQTIASLLESRLKQTHAAILQLIRKGQVRVAGSPCLQATRKLRAGQRIEVTLPGKKSPTPPKAPRPGPVSPSPTLCYVDDHLLVVDKPPGLTTMRHAEEAAEFGPRGQKFLPSTLESLLPGLLASRGYKRASWIRAVHRLDKETSGLLVFARTPEAERHLGKQLRAHTMERLYHALVRGRACSQRIESTLVRDRGDGRRGSGTQPCQGQRAVTHVRVLEDLGELTLVECRLETGRTHQVRIHLGEAGTPLCGEQVYDRPLHGQPLPDPSGAPRVALHATTLGFEHPHTGEWMRWSSPLPADLSALVRQLRDRLHPTSPADTHPD